MRLMILMTTALILSSCCKDPELIKPTPLPLPMKPVLQKITSEEAKQMPRAVYDKLKLRDLQRDGYESQLEAVILSTH